jgi:hypothetical protein
MFVYIIARTSYDDDDINFVLDQHVMLDFYMRYVAPLRHIILIQSQPDFAHIP